MKTCPNCTAAVPELASFCASCGSEFHGADAVPLEPAPPPPVVPQSPWKWVVGIGLLFVLLVGCFVAIQTILIYRQAANSRTVAAVPTQTTWNERNLKQIGLALHNYHDVYNVMPAGGIFDEQGTEFHSWQTALLPFLGYSAKYENVHFDLPWNDVENQWAFDEVIREYVNPSIPMTHTGNGYALSHLAGNSQVFPDNQGLAFKEIVDGTSNTVIAGEVVDGFAPWGYPRNVRNPADGLQGDSLTFGSLGKSDGVMFLKADGSTVFLNQDIDPSVLKALSTPAGGEETPEMPRMRNSPP
ncbi:hypothetical protein CA54_56300 [Symmachiella macrocystis]|uniref:DUF1559 domain-containing protein n=1 Tax=Symmachiella macrocystis TaxID=2527985 RepID=A0A5C6B4J4_9PLAN|nr:DUF1559 domain-containing protein [Symmachiella macrocystis]TWU07225.1 hypothetical protein CA54_56300 [Symmachiella macrocystis]